MLNPLIQMGIEVDYKNAQGRVPFSISGKRLNGKTFDLEVASSQVQTGLLLAGLQAEDKTTVNLPQVVRDHTERMFEYIGVPFTKEKNGAVSVTELSEPIAPFQFTVPGDISAAAFLIVAAVCLPGSDILLKNIGVNPGRTLVLDALLKMGADIQITNEQEICGEPVADIHVKGGNTLQGITVSGDKIAQGVDEIPILALAGCMAESDFVVKGASELRHKESDRLALITQNIRAAGASVESFADGFVIHGNGRLAGGSPWTTKLDHRLAMTGRIAQLICEMPVELEELDSVSISYPRFTSDLQMLIADK
jgi:3-phosphoshikimate 1-carboxyvinyltransferase